MLRSPRPRLTRALVTLAPGYCPSRPGAQHLWIMNLGSGVSLRGGGLWYVWKRRASRGAAQVSALAHRNLSVGCWRSILAMTTRANVASRGHPREEAVDRLGVTFDPLSHKPLADRLRRQRAWLGDQNVQHGSLNPGRISARLRKGFADLRKRRPFVSRSGRTEAVNSRGVAGDHWWLTRNDLKPEGDLQVDNLYLRAAVTQLARPLDRAPAEPCLELFGQVSSECRGTFHDADSGCGVAAYCRSCALPSRRAGPLTCGVGAGDLHQPLIAAVLV